MRLTRKHCEMGAFELDDVHGWLSSEDASHMWGYVPASMPQYGPQLVYGTIGDDAWNEAVADLVTSVRDLCIFSLKHVDIVRVGSRYADQCEDLLQQLAEHFYFQDSKLVCDYLETHHFLIPVLFEVRTKVVQYFGSDILTNLELFTDPEDDIGDSKLFVLILTALPSRDASARLDQLDQEWWLAQPYEVKRAMNIDTHYVNGRV